MPSSFSVLFALLIAIPGILIPLHVISRMARVLSDKGRNGSERIFAGGTMIAMVLLIGLSMYAAQRTFVLLSVLAGLSR